MCHFPVLDVWSVSKFCVVEEIHCSYTGSNTGKCNEIHILRIAPGIREMLLRLNTNIHIQYINIVGHSLSFDIPYYLKGTYSCVAQL